MSRLRADGVHLKDYLTVILERRFPSLRKLIPYHTKLTKNDVESLADLMVQGLLNLEELDLSGNSMTNLSGKVSGHTWIPSSIQILSW